MDLDYRTAKEIPGALGAAGLSRSAPQTKELSVPSALSRLHFQLTESNGQAREHLAAAVKQLEARLQSVLRLDSPSPANPDGVDCRNMVGQAADCSLAQMLFEQGRRAEENNELIHSAARYIEGLVARLEV